MARRAGPFPDLRDALLDQLATRYLRTPTRRSGVLVISNHRESRSWRDKDAKISMRFATLISRLSDEAATKTDNDTGPVRVGVVGIDATVRRVSRKTQKTQAPSATP